MRKFSSYGPVDPDLHYYSPRKELIEKAYTQLMGENPQKGGHYITVWAPRQCGKTWTMQQILFRLQEDPRFDVLKINLEILKDKTEPGLILNSLARFIGEGLNKSFPVVDDQEKFQEIFKKGILEKPLILILDEFDALLEEGINAVVGAFRNIYIKRIDEAKKTTGEKTYLLHAVALIGVRSVLGIENQKGSPFNVQRSVHIPNLTFDEVKAMFQWYEKESGQFIEPEVIDRLFFETNGQPGLTCWFGELLTETYNQEKTAPITMKQFRHAYANASNVLPNNNILNLISKVKKDPYREVAIELFQTDEKIKFRFDNEKLNYLYMNGVIDYESVENENGETESHCKFSSPFVQTRLFNFFSWEIFDYMGDLIHPLDAMEDAISPNTINVRNIMKRYQAYLDKNKETFFKDVPRRKRDLKIYEAIYHFNLYRYLYDLLKKRGVDVIPEFPTGNGKIDLILKYKGRVYALELKSFSDIYDFREGIDQAAQYGQKLGLPEIAYVVFVELKAAEIKQLEQEIEKPGIRVNIVPISVLSGI
ncbi:MAG: AAA-like domain-containing protein [Acidobacteria bacterium]|jgi:hypothetical protein|nr:AAA-like domain-containing protein [Acidobacteriota bacterium]